MKKLTGIFTALLTPFDAEGKVDETSLRRIVEDNIGKGVDGFYVCGSTGEAFLLENRERKRILDAVIECASGRASIICHIGAIGTDLSIDLGKHAVAAGADAVSSIPPFYYKFSSDEIIGYYQDIEAALDIPLIPYNFPSLVGVTLTIEMIRRLRKDPRIVGVKFTSTDLYQLERMKEDDPELIIYNGVDEIFLAGLTMGADGAIGSTYNFMPEIFLAIRRNFETGNMAEARKLQEQANALIQAVLNTGKSLSAHKYVLELRGIPCGGCRKPFLPLTQADKKNLELAWSRFSGQP